MIALMEIGIFYGKHCNYPTKPYMALENISIIKSNRKI